MVFGEFGFFHAGDFSTYENAFRQCCGSGSCLSLYVDPDPAPACKFDADPETNPSFQIKG
jgi:hypothetical protein